jgi:hypothetical protein
METTYKKVGRKYVSIGYNIPDITDGIWIVQSTPYSKSITSLAWKVGDLKRPVDVVTHATIQTIGDELVQYITKLSQEDSPEFKEITKHYGHYIRGPVGLYNISPSDFITVLLRKIATIIERK